MAIVFISDSEPPVSFNSSSPVIFTRFFTFHIVYPTQFEPLQGAKIRRGLKFLAKECEHKNKL